jgi:hypothetical protein
MEQKMKNWLNNALLVPSKPELLGFYRKVDEIR